MPSSKEQESVDVPSVEEIVEHRRLFFELLPVWNRTGSGPEKQAVFNKLYPASVMGGLCRTMRSEELDREFGLEHIPREPMRLTAAETDRYRALVGEEPA